MYMNFLRIFQELIYTVPAVLIAISIHEFAHGFVSDKLGDPTPRADGRLTLNPLKHLDPIGTLSLILFHMGWAKPVRVNTRFYKNRKRDMILVALAGPLGNFLTAFIALLLYGVFYKFGNGTTNYLELLFYYTAAVNIGLGVFNLIPIPPLDGSAVLSEAVGPKVDMFFARYRRYIPMVLLLLLATGVLQRPLGYLNASILNGFWNIVREILRIGVTAVGGGVYV